MEHGYPIRAVSSVNGLLSFAFMLEPRLVNGIPDPWEIGQSTPL